MYKIWIHYESGLLSSNFTNFNQNVTYDLMTPRWRLTTPSYAPFMFLYPRVITTKFDQNWWKTLQMSSNFTNFNQNVTYDLMTPIWHLTPPSYAPSMFLYSRIITAKFDQDWWKTLQMSRNFTNFNQNVTYDLMTLRWPLTPASYAPSMFLYSRVITTKLD